MTLSFAFRATLNASLCWNPLQKNACFGFGNLDPFAQDYIRFSAAEFFAHGDCTADRRAIRWHRIAIVRYAIMTPWLMLFLVVSYTKLFKDNFFFSQLWFVADVVIRPGMVPDIVALRDFLYLVRGCLPFSVSARVPHPLDCA